MRRQGPAPPCHPAAGMSASVPREIPEPPVVEQPKAKLKKRSRKQHLRDLGAEKKRRRVEAAEAADLWVPPTSDEDEDDLLEDSTVEVVGGASARQDQAYRTRRKVARIRGVSQQARAMAAFLAEAQPQAERESRLVRSLAANCAAAAVRAVLAAFAQEHAEELKATHAAEERERYALKKRAAPTTPAIRSVRPRTSRTFSDSKKRGRAAEEAGSSKRPRVRLTVSKEMVATLARLTRTRVFKRADIVGGLNLSRVEFKHAYRDYKELWKIFALNAYVNKRKEGMPSRQAYEEAAQLVTTPRGGHVNWQTVRKWLASFISMRGQIRFDERGRKPKTRSFLDDPEVKAAALQWLREQLQSLRAKNVDSPTLTVHSFCRWWNQSLLKPQLNLDSRLKPIHVTPTLTVHSFCRWCNQSLLKPQLDSDSRLKPIHVTTALMWLQRLGFKYKSHSKSIYYDGHEREDVVRDRMEKLVMAKVLEEVTVHFGGVNCDEVRWPLLHPGERPVVWVSQDESAFHSNDDLASEWAEEGKGLQIKQKSRGSLLMVSAFISELHGILRCSAAERDAYITHHPNSHMAARLAAEPLWDGSSTIIIEPGAAEGKDKYFDAEQLMEQTKLAMEIFDATHISPGRWVHHRSKHGRTSNATYPFAFKSVWLPPTVCMGMFFYDHSSGHGAYAEDALLASHSNKGPDWKGTVAPMRDGWFDDANGVRHSHSMQFKEGDRLVRDITCPPGIDPNNTAPAAAAPPAAAPPQLPPTASETDAAFKLFFSGTVQTLKKRHPGTTTTYSRWAEPSGLLCLLIGR